MSKSKGCPFCGATPHHGLGKVQHCQLHGEPFQDFSIWCPHGHAKITARNEERAREQWDTRAAEIERLTARKVVGPSREEIEEAAHQAIVRWSNGEQPKPIKAMVADAILALLETKAVETVSAKEGRKP